MAGSDYSRVARAIQYLRERASDQPSLGEVAAAVGLSEAHFQRLFQAWAGVSPKRFLQFLTLQAAREKLQASRSLLDASLELGLSGPARLHDLFLRVERMTPGEYKAQAAGLRLRWGIADTPFGPALFGALDRGLCAVDFLLEDGEAGALARLRSRWPGATLEAQPAVAETYAEQLAARLAGDPRPLGVVLKGSPFQLQVWEALLRIPPGRALAYGDVARLAGRPGAQRAVGSALGANALALVIPCHRVIQASGALGDYRWGADRKLALLGYEQALALGA